MCLQVKGFHLGIIFQCHHVHGSHNASIATTTMHAPHVYKAEVAWTIKGTDSELLNCLLADRMKLPTKIQNASSQSISPCFLRRLSGHSFAVQRYVQISYTSYILFHFSIIGNDCVAVPTIINSSDVCRVVSHGSLSFTCKNNGNSLFWKCVVFGDSAIIVIRDSTTHIPEPNVAGLTLTENYTYNAEGLGCIKSTLTFAGSLDILQTLNGLVINCDDTASDTDNATIVIPSEYTCTVATMIFLIQKHVL